MDSAQRYEIVDTIASGDFAAVYRARDRELGREVAVKQIHRQFLADERQLARYWQEAQLLASLQHPNILTIYDIVRSKGWLIVELMRGSLQSAAQGEGIDLDYLRAALTGCLGALQFLHDNGIIHGDVKPSNMLVDAQGRVKLGDFGLARRASDEGGSLLKGTTKYMAPETLSPQFGPVGPASDLYSLGFSAYELMCGAQFETLFPGLSTFGRDKQIAWMMWHAAPDRTLPPIARVLEGVPEDLARVVERLVEKDPARRYRTAKEAWRDLHAHRLPPELTHAEKPDAIAEAARRDVAKRKKRRRFAAIAAVGVSLALCAVILFTGGPRSKPPPPEPLRGVVNFLNLEHAPPTLALKLDDGRPKELHPDARTEIFLNDEPSFLRDLREKDRVVAAFDASGRRFKEIRAFRPEISRGQITEINAAEGRVTVATVLSDGKIKELVVAVSPETAVRINGRPDFDGRPATPTDLLPGDRITVDHIGSESGRKAVEISVERVVPVQGIVAGVKTDASRNETILILNAGTKENPRLVEWPFASDCKISINGRRLSRDRVLNPSDLQPGDEAVVRHDARIVEVEARRTIHDAGMVSARGADFLEILLANEEKPVRCAVGSQTKITINGRPGALADLREGDMVEMVHDSIDRVKIQAVSIAAERPSNPNRWAIVIGVQDYADRSIARPSHARADAKHLFDVLVDRYQTPADQATLLTDEGRARAMQVLRDVSARIRPEGELLVFFAGRAFLDPERRAYLAFRDFDPRQIDATGLPLQWLIDELEKCPAKNKLFLFDGVCAGDDPAKEPSPEEMLRGLKAPPGRGPLRTLTAIAGRKAGQPSLDGPEKEYGLFAWHVGRGYAGEADANRDQWIDPAELFAYLQSRMPAAGAEPRAGQTPEIILPDNRPPRLSEAAKAAVRKLAGFVRQERPNVEEAETAYAEASQAAGAEIEPKLLFGLLLMKTKQRERAAKHFDEVATQYPQALVPCQAIAWLRFERRMNQPGVEELTVLISKIPRPKPPASSYSQAELQLFQWTGQVREAVLEATEEGRRPSAQSFAALDAAVAAHGAEAQKLYEQGREASRAVAADFKKKIPAAETQAEAVSLTIQSQTVARYVDFPYDACVAHILEGMEF